MSGSTERADVQTIRETLDNVAHGPLCGLDACPGCEATAALDSLAAALREAEEALAKIAHPRWHSPGYARVIAQDALAALRASTGRTE